MSKLDKVDRFLSGLEPELEAKLIVSEPQTLDKAISLAMKHEAAKSERIEVVPMEVNKAFEGGKKFRKFFGECFRCNKHGHRKSECRSRKVNNMEVSEDEPEETEQLCNLLKWNKSELKYI
jgi:hypothetical protein